MQTLKRVFTSWVTAYLMMFGLFFINQETTFVRNCHSTQRGWDSVHEVVDAAFHPPSRAGQELTPEQVKALREYRANVSGAAGPRPSCGLIQSG